jgi:hypothetical protein
MLSSKTGFRYPLTPKGEASLLDFAADPTQRIAGNAMVIGFEADPAVVRKYVPEPLELDGSGRVYLWTYDAWFYSERNQTEFVSPERMQYIETLFWIPCDFEGERYHYMLYSWINRDWLAYLGRAVGMPHKIAKVQMTHLHRAEAFYNSPKEGVRICVSVENIGLVLRAQHDLKHEIPVEDMPFRTSNDYCPKFLGWRYFYDVCEDRPAISDLVAHWGDEMEIGPVGAGDADVVFHDAEAEEVLPFKPRRVLGGWYFTILYNHRGSVPQVIHSFEEAQ